QVFAIVGHDLRNPLGAVVMSAALLKQKGGLSGWQARTVDRCRASALRMGRIIDDLLSYTRTRLGGGIPVERAATDLGAVVRRMVDELAAAHPEAQVLVETEGDLSGRWDPARLEQVVSNLVSNAIDHGAEGAPVRVHAAGEQEAVHLVVANRGEMPPGVVEHAFEAFQRGPESTGRKASGLGLGLFIAREIVRRHGGDIGVTCERGDTRVEVRLPRAEPGGEADRPGEGRSTGG
ncbi:MAG TPA: HAMP domain-containing sensor histidine kinase, partial [Anaeromyxobacteraceae bacterium]|nr:HAMP domain-containing sensor histidine kinase [Anaeromyxobacteraceae bacterium]